MLGLSVDVGGARHMNFMQLADLQQASREMTEAFAQSSSHGRSSPSRLQTTCQVLWQCVALVRRIWVPLDDV
jgi:hypothetical protein